MEKLLVALFVINLLIGSLFFARGRELRKKKDPSLLSGDVKNKVLDPVLYTKEVGTLQIAFGIIFIVLGVITYLLISWISLILGDIAVLIVYAVSLNIIKRKHNG